MKNVQISQLLFIPTGQYHDMALRPYSAHVTGDNLDRLASATQDFTNTSPAAMAGVAGAILRPTTQAMGSLSIENGWNEVRFMFMMEVIHHNGGFMDDDASVRVQYITGHTDYAGDPSYTGRIDPNMRLHLTNVITTRELRTNFGLQRRTISANRYLQQNAGQSSRAGHFFSMRPRDVCQTVGHSGLGNNEFVVADYRTSLSSRPMMSTIRNDLASDYMSRLVTGYRTAVNAQDDLTNDLPGLMNSAADNTGEEGAIDDPFVMNLYRHTELSQGSSFTYGELCELFRGTDEVANVLPPMGVAQDIGFDAHRPNDTNHWGGSNNETVLATIIGTAVPALMVEAMLTQVSFTITNDTVNGQPVFQWLSAPRSFMALGDSLERQMIYFEDKMRGEIFTSLSRSGNMEVSLRMFSDLAMSDTRIEVAVDGGDVVPYCVPNFAAAMITPVIANDRSQLDQLASSVNNIFDHMGGQSLQTPSMQDLDDAGFMLGGQSLGSALREREQGSVSYGARRSSNTGGTPRL